MPTGAVVVGASTASADGHVIKLRTESVLNHLLRHVFVGLPCMKQWVDARDSILSAHLLLAKNMRGTPHLLRIFR